MFFTFIKSRFTNTWRANLSNYFGFGGKMVGKEQEALASCCYGPFWEAGFVVIREGSLDLLLFGFNFLCPPNKKGLTPGGYPA